MNSTDRAFSRTARLLGTEAMKKLSECRVAVFGIGGVGGYVVEALARGGVGALDIIDNDTVDITNLNRQIIATRSTIGQYKVDVAAARIRDINPHCLVTTHRVFFLPETAGNFDFENYDYIVDAIDTVSGKLGLIEAAEKTGVPIISAMGAGNKLDPTAFEVADIYKTSVDPLAKVIRHECKKRGIRKLKVVYSKETPLKPLPDDEAYGSSKSELPTSGTSELPAGRSLSGSDQTSLPAHETLSDADKASLPVAETLSESGLASLPTHEPMLSGSGSEVPADNSPASAGETLFPKDQSLPSGVQSSQQKINPPHRPSPGSTSFVPPVVGLIIAGEVIKDLSSISH